MKTGTPESPFCSVQSPRASSGIQARSKNLTRTAVNARRKIGIRYLFINSSSVYDKALKGQSYLRPIRLLGSTDE